MREAMKGLWSLSMGFRWREFERRVGDLGVEGLRWEAIMLMSHG